MINDASSLHANDPATFAERDAEIAWGNLVSAAAAQRPIDIPMLGACLVILGKTIGDFRNQVRVQLDFNLRTYGRRG